MPLQSNQQHQQMTIHAHQGGIPVCSSAGSLTFVAAAVIAVSAALLHSQHLYAGCHMQHVSGLGLLHSK